MADTKISAMPAAATLTGAELTPLVQGGANVRTTTSAIAGLVTVQGNYYQNFGGTTPTVTPTSPNVWAIDSSTLQGWFWTGSVWINLF